MTDIRVDIDIEKVGDLKIRWSRGGESFSHYHVNQQDLVECSRSIRDALQELVDAGRSGKVRDYVPLLSAVAKEGKQLYDALFFGMTASDRNTAGKVKNWIIQHVVPHRDRFTFAVPPRLHIPWGLVYDQPPPPEDDAALSEFCNFWVRKYALVTHYFLIPPVGIDVPWSASSFGLLFGADRKIWDLVVPHVHAREHLALKKVLGRMDVPKFSLAEVLKDWELGHANRTPRALLNLLGHASGRALHLGDDSLTPAQFARQFSRDEASEDLPPTLVFLAGCHTAIGDLNGGFLEATGAPGFCGFVGAEAKIPDVFTLRFLSHFLTLFYGGERTVSEVMAILYARHWPLSIVFTLCCPHDLRLNAGLIQAHEMSHILDDESGSVNLSYERISSG